jgi:hypothetical protein
MEAELHTRLRQKWTIGTVLLMVGWSSVVLWLNIRPQIYTFDLVAPAHDGSVYGIVHYGFPFVYATSYSVHHPSAPHEFHQFHPGPWDGGNLASDVLFGIAVVGLLTWGSGYVLCCIKSKLTCGKADEE